MILRENHEHTCDCSYCQKLNTCDSGSFGFWVPIDKSFNSWWVFFFVGKRGNNRYFRFTIPFLKRPQ